MDLGPFPYGEHSSDGHTDFEPVGMAASDSENSDEVASPNGPEAPSARPPSGPPLTPNLSAAPSWFSSFFLTQTYLVTASTSFVCVLTLLRFGRCVTLLESGGHFVFFLFIWNKRMGWLVNMNGFWKEWGITLTTVKLSTNVIHM